MSRRQRRRIRTAEKGIDLLDDSTPDLTEQLEASNSLFVENCEGARYGVMCTYHDLESLDVVWTLGGPVREQIDFALSDDGIAVMNHRRHEENGTCVLSEPPDNDRTRQWRT